MCEHVCWLRLAGKDDYYIHHSNRLVQLLRILPAANNQYPFISLFLGTKTKDALLRKTFKLHAPQQRHENRFINIHLDQETVGEEQPYLIIEGDLNHDTPPIHTNRDRYHEDEILQLR